MSQTELHTGKAFEVSTGFKGLRNKLDANGVDTAELKDDELDDGYVDAKLGYVYIGSSDKLFKLQEHSGGEADDYICRGSKTDDTIDFTLMFHNGGTCFEEMFEDLVNKIEKQSNEL